MTQRIKIKKGLDIPLAGCASDRVEKVQGADLYAIAPDDFGGYTWKACVKPGDSVALGAPLMQAKEEPSLCLVSPVAGEVAEVHRGERRKIEYISVRENGQSKQATDFDAHSDIKERLMRSGLFAMMRQRPFDIVPDTKAEPRDIFITSFDSAPLASDMGSDPLFDYLEEGVKVLSKMTKGKVYLGVRPGSGISSEIAEVIEFEGPHPAGNPGTQIAAIEPVDKGETVWTLDALTAARIGKFAKTGELDFSARVALTGPCLSDPHIADTTIGVSLKALLAGAIKDGEGKVRIISGNVLTGIKESENGFLRYPYRQVTVIEEGDDADEFMGWASVNPGKYSVKRSFPAFLRGLSKPFRFDARIKGGHRALILSGEFDKVFPMDILPEYLIKAIQAKDIEKMEQLGIYEVAPEDFALAEFVDTSKTELQKLVREGLDYLRKETI